MSMLEWFRAPMIGDDAGEPVRRFCPLFSVREPNHADDGVREVYRRLTSACSMTVGLWLIWLTIGGIAGVFAGVLAGSIVHLVIGTNRARSHDLDLPIGVATGIVTTFALVIAGIMLQDRGRTERIIRTLRAEGRCGSCGRSLPARGEGAGQLSTCECGARWTYEPALPIPPHGAESPEWDDEDNETITDLSGRVLRMVSSGQLERRDDMAWLVGTPETRARVRRWVWLSYLLVFSCVCLWFYFSWFRAARGAGRVAIGVLIAFFGLAQIMSIRHQAGRPLKTSMPRSVACKLLVREFCPACATTLQIGTDPREIRSCPGCGAVWPGASEMSRHGYPRMDPGVCPTCSYDVSRCATGPGRLVRCPECGTQSRLAKLSSAALG